LLNVHVGLHKAEEASKTRERGYAQSGKVLRGVKPVVQWGVLPLCFNISGLF